MVVVVVVVVVVVTAQGTRKLLRTTYEQCRDGWQFVAAQAAPVRATSDTPWPPDLFQADLRHLQ